MIHIGRVSIGFLFEPRDLWIGVYWTTWADVGGAMKLLTLYLCLLPMLPMRLDIVLREP